MMLDGWRSICGEDPLGHHAMPYINQEVPVERRYRLQETDSPQGLAVVGKGHPEELHAVNKTWLSSDFLPWNPGQQMVIPAAWAPIAGEYPS